MVKKAPYTKLNIDQDQIETAVAAFFSEQPNEYIIGDLKLLNGSRYRLEFTYLKNNYAIDFHFNNDGTTTINCSSGKSDPIKSELAEYIKNSPICTMDKISNFENPWFVFEDFDYNDFLVVLSLIKEKEGVSQTKYKKINGGELWTLKSQKGEQITINLYKKNKKAVVQGKPLALFSEVYTSLISLVDVETIPEIMNQRSYIAEEVTKESIEKELDFYLPDSSDRLSTKVKILCCQSIFNLKIHNEMFDYSFLTFPALKLLEGHLKYIMKEKSIPLEDNNFSMFVRISTKPKKYVLNSNFIFQCVYIFYLCFCLKYRPTL